MRETIEELGRRIEKLERSIKTPEDYLALTKLEWKRQRIIAERTVRQMQIAPQLVEAYLKTGQMTVMHRYQQITVTSFSGPSAMERAYSVTHEAKYLAWLATEPLPPLTVSPLVDGLPSR